MNILASLGVMNMVNDCDSAFYSLKLLMTVLCFVVSLLWMLCGMLVLLSCCRVMLNLSPNVIRVCL